VFLNVDTDGQWRVNTYAATLEPVPIPESKSKPKSGGTLQTPQTGKRNRPSGILDFDRWVGHWTSTIDFKPTADTSNEKTVPGVMRVRKVLDDRFLLSHFAADTDPMQFLSLLTYDENFAAYRIWVFGTAGEAYERRGQWDAAGETLTLQLQPPTPGVTGASTDHFVHPHQIESTVLVKAADGQVTRDVRWTSRRKGTDVTADITAAPGPSAMPAELSLLNKFVGEWSIRAANKPSVWIPNGGQETQTEKVMWILGGRFLMARTFNAQGQLKTIWIATYEPSEKANHFWFFMSDGMSGQWRVTWDEASRGFHWRSIDMPPGWIGTGFNRWINDDTFDNQSLIKDENGRVMFDGTQDKKRMK
jgi:hypothetical protein